MLTGAMRKKVRQGDRELGGGIVREDISEAMALSKDQKK